jgi:hypothetical protein
VKSQLNNVGASRNRRCFGNASKLSSTPFAAGPSGGPGCPGFYVHPRAWDNLNPGHVMRRPNAWKRSAMAPEDVCESHPQYARVPSLLLKLALRLPSCLARLRTTALQRRKPGLQLVQAFSPARIRALAYFTRHGLLPLCLCRVLSTRTPRLAHCLIWQSGFQGLMLQCTIFFVTESWHILQNHGVL